MQDLWHSPSGLLSVRVADCSQQGRLSPEAALVEGDVELSRPTKPFEAQMHIPARVELALLPRPPLRHVPCPSSRARLDNSESLRSHRSEHRTEGHVVVHLPSLLKTSLGLQVVRSVWEDGVRAQSCLHCLRCSCEGSPEPPLEQGARLASPPQLQQEVKGFRRWHCLAMQGHVAHTVGARVGIPSPEPSSCTARGRTWAWRPWCLASLRGGCSRPSA